MVYFSTNYHYDRRLVFSIKSGDLPNKEFQVSRTGDIVLEKSLDYETESEYHFHVIVTNGDMTDTAEVTINVINVNDWNPTFKYPEYSFFVSEKSAVDGAKIGHLEVNDGDKDDRISLDIKGDMSKVFGVTADGDLTIDNIGYMRGQEAHILVMAQVISSIFKD